MQSTQPAHHFGGSRHDFGSSQPTVVHSSTHSSFGPTVSVQSTPHSVSHSFFGSHVSAPVHSYQPTVIHSVSPSEVYVTGKPVRVTHLNVKGSLLERGSTRIIAGLALFIFGMIAEPLFMMFGGWIMFIGLLTVTAEHVSSRRSASV